MLKMKRKLDAQTRTNLAALRKSGGSCWTPLKKVKRKPSRRMPARIHDRKARY
jgi:hypothetical protein